MSFGWSNLIVILLFLISRVWPHPIVPRPKSTQQEPNDSAVDLDFSASLLPDIVLDVHNTYDATPAPASLQALYQGNQRFRHETLGLVKNVDKPPKFMSLHCTDHSVQPIHIFNMDIGASTVQVNLGNQYSGSDSNANSAIAYAVLTSGIRHIIVLGHYDCPAIHEAVMRTKSTSHVIRDWLAPVYHLYLQSKRMEIVQLRNSLDVKNEDKYVENGLRALVEENVKANVNRLKTEGIISEIFAEDQDNNDPVEVFVHGFVYDGDSGEVKDLGVSFGPPGKAVEFIPFQAAREARMMKKWVKFDVKAKKVALKAV